MGATTERDGNSSHEGVDSISSQHETSSSTLAALRWMQRLEKDQHWERISTEKLISMTEIFYAVGRDLKPRARFFAQSGVTFRARRAFAFLIRPFAASKTFCAAACPIWTFRNFTFDRILRGHIVYRSSPSFPAKLDNVLQSIGIRHGQDGWTKWADLPKQHLMHLD